VLRPVTWARPLGATEVGIGRALCEPVAHEMNDAQLLSASFWRRALLRVFEPPDSEREGT
jgi:hypothetical protein